MYKYKLVPVGVSAWAVKRFTWLNEDRWLETWTSTNTGVPINAVGWTCGTWHTPAFASKQEALDALAWVIRLRGIQEAHRRLHIRRLKARTDRATTIPPWPTTKAKE